MAGRSPLAVSVPGVRWYSAGFEHVPVLVPVITAASLVPRMVTVMTGGAVCGRHGEAVGQRGPAD